jgi:hypothetical protein
VYLKGSPLCGMRRFKDKGVGGLPLPKVLKNLTNMFFSIRPLHEASALR